MRTHFNLYYLHWWSLTHFLFHYDNGRYQDSCLNLIQDGGNPAAFTNRIGTVERIQSEWHAYVVDLKKKR